MDVINKKLMFEYFGDIYGGGRAMATNTTT
jgi:hypothetical protein